VATPPLLLIADDSVEDRSREPQNKYQIPENHSSGAKARVDDADFSGTAEAVPFQNISTCRN
jgi:hypothetical protein